MNGDDYLNSVCAAGCIYAALEAADLDPQIVASETGGANVLTVQPEFMKSRYRITLTVERILDDATYHQLSGGSYHQLSGGS